MLERACFPSGAERTVSRFFSCGRVAVKVNTLGLGLLFGRHHVLLNVVRQSHSGTLTNPGVEVSAFAPLVATPWATVVCAELFVHTSGMPIFTSINATLYLSLEMLVADLLPSRAVIFPHTVIIP